MTDAELRALLLDCLALWGTTGDVIVRDETTEIRTAAGRFLLRRAASDERPMRWWLHTPDRIAAGRRARALPSIVATLTALRRAQ